MKSQTQFSTSFLRSFFSKSTTPLALAVFAMLVKGAPAQALTFNFSYAEGTSQDVIYGFEKAGSLWSNQINDTYLDTDCFCNRDTNVNLFINFGELSSDNALGGARPGMVRVDYKKYLTASFQNISSEDDLTAFKNLQLDDEGKGAQTVLAGFGVSKYNTDRQNVALLTDLGLSVDTKVKIEDQGNQLLNQLNLSDIQKINRNQVKFESDEFNMLVSDKSIVDFDDKKNELSRPNESVVLDSNGNDNNKKVWLTSANARALNLIDGDDDAFDGEIAINSKVLGKEAGDVWDFGRVYDDNATVNSSKYDFLSVATHEIGHTLGFVSGLDAFEMLLSTAAEGEGNSIEDKDLDYVAPMDLFRYSEDSTAAGTFDWSTTSGERYFSIDGGNTRLADFATGVGIDGDGYQSSHWAQKDNVLGVMNPTLKRGEALSITELDLQFLDVLGWERAGSETFEDMTGVDVELAAIEEGLSQKIDVVGLDWKSLEKLLTKPAEQLLTELNAERAALYEHREGELTPQLTAAKTALESEESRLKSLQQIKESEIKAVEEALKDQSNGSKGSNSQLSELQEEQADIEKEVQDLEEDLSKNLEKFNKARKDRDRAKYQKKIDQIQEEITEFAVGLRFNKDAQSNILAGQQNSPAGSLKASLTQLQTELQNLQTSPLLETLTAQHVELDTTLKKLRSLEGQASKLASASDSYRVKTKLQSLRDNLSNKLYGLNSVGDGEKRAKEEQKILNEVKKLAQSQEVLWNQLVTDSEEALFPGAESQVKAWLTQSPEALKTHMATATTTQLAALYAQVDSAEGSQKEEWFSKLTQASMLLGNVDQATAEKGLDKALENLRKVLEKSGPDELLSRGRSTTSDRAWRYWLSRGRSTRMDRAFRYWQTANPSFITENEYSEEGAFVDGVESATLNQMLYSTASPENREEVPEPSSIFALLLAGGLGAKLRRRR